MRLITNLPPQSPTFESNGNEGKVESRPLKAPIY